MNFNEYQKAARETAIYPNPIIYPALGLNGEAGEVAEKIKKMLRDDNGILLEDRREAIKMEISDCLWYIANMASDLGYNLEDIAEANLAKLRARKERNVLKGDGDNR